MNEVTKPDTDNLQKMLKDCMTQRILERYAQVVKETCEKDGQMNHVEYQ